MMVLVTSSLMASSYLQTCCKLLKQLGSISLRITFDNELALSLLTTCSRFVISKPEQAM